MPFKFRFCGKAEKETYRVLDYAHNNLLNVPTDIYEHAQSLEELYLDANQLKDLPKALFTLQHLKLLNIGDNEIISLPSNVSNLVHLIEFDISKNGFLELPDSIKGMKSLQHFDLSVNPLGRLPDGFTMLLNLTQVYLNDTFLDFLPANIGRMAKLEILEVRDNHLTMIPKSMSRLQNLRRLDIGNNEFSELPEVVGTFSSLKELWVDGNKIKQIPPDIGNLKKLQYLDATENAVEWIADEIGECESLTDLHLTTNNVMELPENLCKLKMLETLKVDDNHLTYLPTSIGGLSNLEELICSSNELETLPPGIGLLRKLTTLNADENYVEYLPDEIGSCISLTVVLLRQNRIQNLPDDFGRLSNLTVLNVSANVLENLPYSLMKLKKLKALWLSENQAKPLIPLQTDWDATNERRYLTCYMFPQRPLNDMYEEEPNLVEQSFHASLFEEEWKKRTSVLFDVEEEDPQVVRLTRQPTPFPKDIRDRITNFRNQAIAKGQVSGNHMSDHIIPHHPYHPKDEVEAKVHPNRPAPPTHPALDAMDAPPPDNQPYTAHQNLKQPQHVTEEERLLLEQLRNSSIPRDPNAELERQRMQDALRKYQGDVKRLNDGGNTTGAPRAMNFSVPIAPSPLTSRHFKDDDSSSFDDFAVDGKRGIKLSSDSGLGSTDLCEEQNSWKNEYPTIPEQEDVFRVTINKTPHLGFSVSGGVDAPGNPFRPDDYGIFVTKVLADSPASSLLQPGDKVLEVNGVDFKEIIHEDAVKILKASEKVDLLISRRLTDQT